VPYRAGDVEAIARAISCSSVSGRGNGRSTSSGSPADGDHGENGRGDGEFFARPSQSWGVLSGDDDRPAGRRPVLARRQRLLGGRTSVTGDRSRETARHDQRVMPTDFEHPRGGSVGDALGAAATEANEAFEQGCCATSSCWPARHGVTLASRRRASCRA
jgi:hypothetical protein